MPSWSKQSAQDGATEAGTPPCHHGATERPGWSNRAPARLHAIMEQTETGTDGATEAGTPPCHHGANRAPRMEQQRPARLHAIMEQQSNRDRHGWSNRGRHASMPSWSNRAPRMEQQSAGTPPCHHGATETGTDGTTEAGQIAKNSPAPHPEAPGGAFLFYIYIIVCVNIHRILKRTNENGRGLGKCPWKNEKRKNERNREKSPKNGSK